MKLDFTGKVALVTGATKGIGFATAKALAESGADVIVNGRSEESTSAAAGKIGARGISGDLSSVGGCERLVKSIEHVDPRQQCRDLRDFGLFRG